jgi:hypothetical protein
VTVVPLQLTVAPKRRRPRLARVNWRLIGGLLFSLACWGAAYVLWRAAAASP